MRTAVVITLLVACAFASNEFLAPAPEANKKGTTDFVTGFFLAMRAAEKVPHAFECATKGAEVQKLFAEFQAKIQDHFDILAVLDFVAKIVPALEEAGPGCKAVSSELVAYVAEIKGIVTKKTFAVDAGKALFKHRKVVAQDVADFKDAKVAEDFLLAGMKIGEIGRIAVWGSPAE